MFDFKLFQSSSFRLKTHSKCSVNPFPNSRHHVFKSPGALPIGESRASCAPMKPSKHDKERRWRRQSSGKNFTAYLHQKSTRFWVWKASSWSRIATCSIWSRRATTENFILNFISRVNKSRDPVQRRRFTVRIQFYAVSTGLPHLFSFFKDFLFFSLSFRVECLMNRRAESMWSSRKM